jgi:hypothetical protein
MCSLSCKGLVSDIDTHMHTHTHTHTHTADNSIGIFPEGGSHDRTELLPLKAGVTLMALGAVEKYKVPVKIVPCGLNYFFGHKFRYIQQQTWWSAIAGAALNALDVVAWCGGWVRWCLANRSRVALEFGEPYEILPESELVEQYRHDKRASCSALLETITARLRSVRSFCRVSSCVACVVCRVSRFCCAFAILPPGDSEHARLQGAAGHPRRTPTLPTAQCQVRPAHARVFVAACRVVSCRVVSCRVVWRTPPP